MTPDDLFSTRVVVNDTSANASRIDSYELGIDARVHRRVADAFTELARTI